MKSRDAWQAGRQETDRQTDRTDWEQRDRKTDSEQANGHPGGQGEMTDWQIGRMCGRQHHRQNTLSCPILLCCPVSASEANELSWRWKEFSAFPCSMALRPRVSRIVYWTPPQLLFFPSSWHLSLHSPGWPKRKTHFPLTKFMKFSLIFKRSQRSQEEQPEEGFTARAGEAQPAPPRRLIYVNKSANLWGFVFRIWCASCCHLEEEGEDEEPAQGVPQQEQQTVS